MCNFYIIFCFDIYVDKKKMGYNRKCFKEVYIRILELVVSLLVMYIKNKCILIFYMNL